MKIYEIYARRVREHIENRENSRKQAPLYTFINKTELEIKVDTIIEYLDYKENT